MTNTKPQAVFAESMELVKERVKALQGEKKARNEILVELNKLIHDPELFAQRQRANAVRDINKACGLKVSMNEIKRAIKTVNTAKPEAATPVDGLSGKATLDLEQHAHKDPAETGATKAPDAKPAAKPAGSKRGQSAAKPTHIKSPAPANSNTTQESNAMRPVKETLQAVSDLINVDAPQSHEEKVAALNAILNAAGATTEEARLELINGFISANPTLSVTWNLMKAYPQGEHGIVGTLVAYLEIDPDNKAKFEGYLAPVGGVEEPAAPVAPVADLGTAAATAAINTASAANPATPANTAAPAAPGTPAAPEVAVSVAVAANGVKEKFMTTIRGNRETGFSSGVVAAATAVVGGGLEMAFKGSATIGSGVGTALGATGAYFLGNATEKMMESETGRYLLAGAIGVVAGGLGSRLGREVQGQYINPSAETIAVLETIPGAPVAQPAPTVANAEALLGMFGL